jgi:PAP2 superfamily
MTRAAGFDAHARTAPAVRPDLEISCSRERARASGPVRQAPGASSNRWGVSVSQCRLVTARKPCGSASRASCRAIHSAVNSLGFLRDWVPFVALFLGYEAVRGIAPKAGFPRHYGFVIRLDKVMFGGVVPSQWLQAHLGSLRWLAIACTVVYFCHFVIPVGVGMVLWLVDRVQFLRYTVALLAMSFAGFVVFLILPVAPPWLAGRHHLLTGVHSLIALPGAVSPIYNQLDPDVAAAFPSLHAAYPLLAALALWPVARRGGRFRLVGDGLVQHRLPRTALRDRRARRHRVRRGHLADHDQGPRPAGSVAAATARSGACSHHAGLQRPGHGGPGRPGGDGGPRTRLSRGLLPGAAVRRRGRRETRSVREKRPSTIPNGPGDLPSRRRAADAVI